MTKPLQSVANTRNCDEVTARAFLEAVQQRFHGAVPPFRLIAQHAAQLPKATPEQVARSISPDLKHRPTKKKKIRGSTVKKNGGDVEMRVIQYEDDAAPSGGWHSRRKNPLRSLNRLDPDRAPTCPHGIPFYRICAICNNDKFREMTGIG